jgi:general stress protein YciG
MTHAKIKEHEPTTDKREMAERIAESGQTRTNPEEAAEIARKKGMAKVLLAQQKLAANTNKDQLD